MPAIKSLEDISSKWATVTPARQGEFEAGVKNPKKDWATNTAASKEAYEQGIQESIANDSFSKGVQKAGTQKWQEQTLTKGVGRWGAGVRGAQQAYKEGFAPYHDTIARTTLPPRFGRGDPRNIDRVAVLAAALHKTRVSSAR